VNWRTLISPDESMLLIARLFFLLYLLLYSFDPGTLF